MDLICGMGANTIRLAHYQHDQYFYDLCDERGMVVWAEIPYISSHMAEGTENTKTQMTELIEQNYNHPSIVVWGLSNEITMSEDNAPGLVEDHRMLNQLAHQMDPTRLTTMAIIGGCSMDNEYVRIPDVKSYNLYKGWYEGTIPENGEFLDEFHEKYPQEPIGLSEYGCDASDWHTSKPRQGDYTEEYQAYYHEEMIRQLEVRSYLWATHVWNMFDFAADARSEGGTSGLNMKGLVTFDRKYCKDAYFAYKAWLSDEAFVHICGKRYTDRVEDVTRVTVYSNQPEVALYVNGELLEKQRGKYFFYYNVPNTGETVLTAKAGNVQDESRIRKVDTFPETYLMKESGDVLNWYEITEVEGYFSLNDKICDIMATEDGKKCMGALLAKTFGGIKRPEETAAGTGETQADAAGSSTEKGRKSVAAAGSPTETGEENASAAAGADRGAQAAMKNAMGIISSMTVKRFLSVMSTRSEAAAIGKEGMLKLNEQLNKIAKE